MKRVLSGLFTPRKRQRSSTGGTDDSTTAEARGSSIMPESLPTDPGSAPLAEAGGPVLAVDHSANLQVEDAGPSDIVPLPSVPQGALPDEHGVEVVTEGVAPIVDIVAVHGLDGHRERSWTASNDVFWLRDLLPNDIPNARILTYGYDANTHSSEGVADQSLFELGDGLLADLSLHRRKTKTIGRPIIFVAHSFGGIVVKSALIKSDSVRKGNLEKQKDIKLSTYGILFFGTPHLGIDDIEWTNIILNIVYIKQSINTNVLQRLKRDSEVLRQQISSYTQISGDFDNKFFCEIYETPIGLGNIKKLIVPPAYAVIQGMPNAEVYRLSKNHRTLVKFEGANESGYKKVSDLLSEMVEECPKQITKNWEEWNAGLTKKKIHYKIPMKLPYGRNPNFVGRKEQLDQIHKLFRGSSRNSLTKEILSGTGGMGKTQIALEYAYCYESEYSSIFWVNGTSLATTTEAFYNIAQSILDYHLNIQHDPTPNYTQIAHDLGMAGLVDTSGPNKGKISLKPDLESMVVDSVKNWFSIEKNDRWLLILDNVDDIEGFDISKFFPHCSKGGCIIITSRRQDCGFNSETQLVEGLDEESGVTLLFTSAGVRIPGEAQAQTDAAEIVKTLGSMPLAITQAGAYIFVSKISLGDYLSMYKRNFAHLASKKPRGFSWQYGEHTIFTTWEISFNAIESENPMAAEILLLCSFMSNEDIKEKIFLDDRNECEIRDCIEILFSYSLAKRTESANSSCAVIPGFSVHPVIHSWARERTPTDKTRCFKKVVILLDKILQRYPGIKTERLLLPHWRVSIGYRGQYEILIEPSNPRNIKVLSRIAGLLYSHGSVGQGMRLACEQVEKANGLWGPDSNITIYSTSILAFIYHDQGLLEKAETLEVAVLEASKRVLGEDHPETLTSMNNLANTYHKQGKLEKAETLQVAVLEARKRVLGEDHPETLTSMNNLASTYQGQGKLENAEALQVAVLEAMKRVLGEDHPKTLSLMKNLAFTYRSQGKLEKAEALKVAVVEAMTRVLEEGHLGTLTI